MKRSVSVLLAVLTALALAACGGDGGGGKPQVPFEVGTDTAEYTVDGAAGWTVQTTNVKIAAGDDVLYNGTVTLALYDCCEQFLEGTLTYGDLQVVGLKEGMVGLVKNERYTAAVPQEIRDHVDSVEAQIMDGTLQVESGLKRYTSQDTLNALIDSLDPTK